jgi:hypothetical protein
MFYLTRTRKWTGAPGLDDTRTLKVCPAVIEAVCTTLLHRLVPDGEQAKLDATPLIMTVNVALVVAPLSTKT